jgi:hypothetical protein
VFNVGLSDVERIADLHVSCDSRESSLNPISSEGPDSTIPVKLERLDRYEREILAAKEEGRVLILKVDVQGHELEVLRGAKNILMAFDIVYLECSFVEHPGSRTAPTFAAACEELLAFGLNPVLFRDFGRKTGPYASERDVIFVKSELTTRINGF